MFCKTSITIRVNKIAALAFLGSLLCAGNLSAQGDLLIYPKRLVFDGTKRSQDLSLVNNGHDTARYVISVVQIRMKEEGSFENISQPDPGQNFADKNFRFFPRNVVLAPGETQTVKVQLVQFSTLPAGEYRSHLYFRSEEKQAPLGDQTTRSDSGALSIRITPIYGLSIPVLIRSGQPTTQVSLSKMTFRWERDSLPLVQINLDRNGNMSAYGDIQVDHLSPEGKETRVALVKGVAIYTPNITRRVRVTLDRQTGVDYRKGSLHVFFTETSGKKQQVAQGQIYLW